MCADRGSGANLWIMATKTIVHRDVWGHEREGYTEARQVAYAPATSAAMRTAPAWLRFEQNLGSLGAGAGVIWAVQVATSNLPNLEALLETPGPLEACAVGALIWLHAKWRRSVLLH